MSILILFASLISFCIHYLIVVCDILHLFYCCVCVDYCVYVDPWGHGKDEEYHGFAINIVLLWWIGRRRKDKYNRYCGWIYLFGDLTLNFGCMPIRQVILQLRRTPTVCTGTSTRWGLPTRYRGFAIDRATARWQYNYHHWIDLLCWCPDVEHQL